MRFKTTRSRRLVQSALVGAATACSGLVLWQTPFGEAWSNASYDYLFRFGARTVTNPVEVILLDNAAYDAFHQDRGRPWDRSLHARLLNKLADDGCAMVVLDSFFRSARDSLTDHELAAAMRRQKVVLMAEQAALSHNLYSGARPALPAEPFLSAASNHWGVAWLDPDIDGVVRRHWPFPSPGPYQSLPWVAAHLAGTQLDQVPRGQWLRYYGPNGDWQSLSYGFALEQPTNYYRGKIVFIGTQPRTTLPGDEADEFRTPYTRWTGESTGGVQIMVTSLLNLANGEWLRRPVWWSEALVLIVSGILLGLMLVGLRPLTALIVGTCFAAGIALIAIIGSHETNYWFPWLVICGGQVPVAFAGALIARTVLKASQPRLPRERRPETPDYELMQPPFGGGAYGKVWLARHKSGRWRALKAVYLANFDADSGPYEREFNGIKRYQPLSDQHPGLLRVDFVSGKMPAGYFYYVMELGDPLTPDWEKKPSTYKPRDLVSERARFPGRKLPVRECLRIGIALAESLEFLHQHGITHRDIKPQNIIFVGGHPKLADLGLVTEIRPPDEQRTYVGTPGYMPPPPEAPGTPQADIYALGMMLFVLSTGRNPVFFPEIATTLAASGEMADFLRLNPIILKACEPDATLRYTSAAELLQALQRALANLQA